MTSALDKIIEGNRLISEGLAEIRNQGMGTGRTESGVIPRDMSKPSGQRIDGTRRVETESPTLTNSASRPESLEGDLDTLKWRKGDRGGEWLPLKDVPQSILNQFQIGLGKTIGTKSYWRSDKYLSRRDAK